MTRTRIELTPFDLFGVRNSVVGRDFESIFLGAVCFVATILSEMNKTYMQFCENRYISVPQSLSSQRCTE
jgi:hypothetical protein